MSLARRFIARSRSRYDRDRGTCSGSSIYLMIRCGCKEGSPSHDAMPMIFFNSVQQTNKMVVVVMMMTTPADHRDLGEEEEGMEVYIYIFCPRAVLLVRSKWLRPGTAAMPGAGRVSDLPPSCTDRLSASNWSDLGPGSPRPDPIHPPRRAPTKGPRPERPPPGHPPSPPVRPRPRPHPWLQLPSRSRH